MRLAQFYRAAQFLLRNTAAKTDFAGKFQGSARKTSANAHA